MIDLLDRDDSGENKEYASDYYIVDRDDLSNGITVETAFYVDFFETVVGETGKIPTLTIRSETEEEARQNHNAACRKAL